MKKLNNILLIVFCSLLLTGCFATITPKPIVSKTASFSGTNSNSGILYTETFEGKVIYVVIDKNQVNVYNSLINKYSKEFLPPLNQNEGIINLGNDKYKIDSEHFAQFALMIKWYKEGK